MSDDLFVPTDNPEADDVNLPSIMMLNAGVVEDFVIERLAALLRSDFDLHPALRKLLADALEGQSPHLQITISRKNKRGPRLKELPIAKSLRAFSGNVERGKWIAAHPEINSKVENAIQDAMTHFDIQRSEAYAAWRVWKEWQEEIKHLQSKS